MPRYEHASIDLSPGGPNIGNIDSKKGTQFIKDTRQCPGQAFQELVVVPNGGKGHFAKEQN